MINKSVFVEIFSIVLGVLLALGVSEWNEDRVNARLAGEALEQVASEVARNQKILQTVHESNKGIVAQISNAEPGSSDGNNQFVPGLQIQNTAWETMIASGVNEHVPFDLLQSLSAAYSFQEIYMSLSYQMINNIMATSALARAIREDVDLPDDLFLENMNLVVLTESGLDVHYTNAIKKLGEHGYKEG